MNKTSLVESISIRTGFSKRQVDLVVNLFLNGIVESVQNGEGVEIRGFGSFSQLVQEKRKIKSPIAGGEIEAPAKKKISFKASKSTEIEIEGA